MYIALQADAQRFIQQRLSAGRFHSADEVIHAALALLERQQAPLAREVSYDLLQQSGAVGMVAVGATDLSSNPKPMCNKPQSSSV